LPLGDGVRRVSIDSNSEIMFVYIIRINYFERDGKEVDTFECVYKNKFEKAGDTVDIQIEPDW
jgi:hypothetical protein